MDIAVVSAGNTLPFLESCLSDANVLSNTLEDAGEDRLARGR